jgi:AmiR/NasT family two-component response regulator
MNAQRILVVEDNALEAIRCSNFIQALGHELVGLVPTGEKAVELCDKMLPDIILMDIQIEGPINGIQTTNLILKKHDIPIVYCTSEEDSRTVKEAMQNSYGYILKPYNESTLRINLEIAAHKHKVYRHLQNARKEFETMVENLHEPFLVLSGSEIFFAHPLISQLFGLSTVEELSGRNIFSIFPATTCDVFLEIMNRNIPGFRHIQSLNFYKAGRKTFRRETELISLNINDQAALQVIF